MNNLKYITIIVCLIAFNCFGQEVLTITDAVKTAVENNYQIITAGNNLKIDFLSVSPGFAGMLPTLEASIDDTNSVQNLSQTRSDGSQVEQDNAKNNNLSYGVALDWTLFDGLSMFANYEQLKQNQNLGEQELKQVILTK